MKLHIQGGGVIGLSCAWRAARAGVDVTVIDPNRVGRGASWAAAGMIAPAFEALAEDEVHPILFEAGLASADLWPGFASDLETDAGLDVGLDKAPALALATDEDQASRLERLAAALISRALPATVMTGAEVRRLEPALSSGIIRAVELPSDHQVDNRFLTLALAEAAARGLMGELSP